MGRKAGKENMRNKQWIIQWLDKNQDQWLCRILSRYYELITYLIFGVLTTLVNLVIYTVLETLLGQGKWYLSNLPAILLAILFAYLTNRSFVFDSAGDFWVEMYKFFGARVVVSLVCEYGVVYLLYNILHFTAELNLIFFTISWFKIISTLMVLVANYVASKLFVFKNNGKKTA